MAIPDEPLETKVDQIRTVGRRPHLIREYRRRSPWDAQGDLPIHAVPDIALRDACQVDDCNWLGRLIVKYHESH
jgi:hypothetical protein